jgi:putative flippase GtrA
MKQILRKLIDSRFLVFLLVGGFNTLFGYILFALFFKVGQLHYTLALMLAYAVGVFLSYATHKRFTFQQAKNQGKSLAKYVSSYAVIFILNSLFLSLLVEVLTLDPLLGQMIAIVVITLLSFVIQKYWVFAVTHDR